MTLKINGTRPERIEVNGTQFYTVYTNTADGNTPLTCVWSKRAKVTLVDAENGYITVTRSNTENLEDPTTNVETGDYVYYGDTITINCYPVSADYDIANVRMEFVNSDLYTKYIFPYTMTIPAESMTDTTDVIFTPTFKEHVKSWHTVWTGSYSFTKSSSTSSYTTSTYMPTGYLALDDTSYTRITGYLRQVKGTTTSISKTLSKAVGSQSFTVNKVAQSLTVTDNGLVSKVKSAKSGLYTYVYYWQVTKIEQYY